VLRKKDTAPARHAAQEDPRTPEENLHRVRRFGREDGNDLEGVPRHRLAVEGLVLREREVGGDCREIGVGREPEVDPSR
jgi:hypothetical protein